MNYDIESARSYYEEMNERFDIDRDISIWFQEFRCCEYHLLMLWLLCTCKHNEYEGMPF